jgi:catalase
MEIKVLVFIYTGSKTNYEPNSMNNGKNTFNFNEEGKYSPYRVTGLVARHKPNHPNSDFAQPGVLFRKVMCDKAKRNTICNVAGHMKEVPR